MRVAVVACVIGMMLAVTSAQPAVSPAAVPQEEVRGLWVLRSTLTTPERIDELIRSAVDGGFNTLLVQVRGRGDAYYNSTIDPRADDLATQPASFDPLAWTITRAHAAGLKVHAWFNVNLVASATTLPKAPTHVVVRQPDWLMVPQPLATSLSRVAPRSAGYLGQLARWTRDRSGTVEGLFLSPIPEGAQQYTVDVVRDLMTRYALDGLHLDYIRYPTPDFDYSAGALAAFRAQHAPAVPAADRQRLERQQAADPLIWTRTYPGAWENFRLARLTTLVSRIRAVVADVRPGATLSAAVLPDPAEARRQKLQDWSQWASAGLLDVIAPMAYATDIRDFTRQVDATLQGAHGVPVWTGIGAWRLTVNQTTDHLRVVRRLNSAGVVLFSYDSLQASTTPRGTYFTRLRPALLAIDGDR